jgi:hypothetical protein
VVGLFQSSDGFQRVGSFATDSARWVRHVVVVVRKWKKVLSAVLNKRCASELMISRKTSSNHFGLVPALGPPSFLGLRRNSAESPMKIGGSRIGVS